MVKLEQVEAENVYISSVYMPSNRLEELQHLTFTIVAKQANLLIGCASKAKHTLSGSSKIKSFSDFNINKNLFSVRIGQWLEH